MINYQEIIEELDDNKVKDMLDKLNIPFEDRGDYILMPTVCHNADSDEASWKLYYYKNYLIAINQKTNNLDYQLNVVVTVYLYHY